MAVWVIMRAIDALNLLPLPNRLDLMEALGLNNAELAHWEEVSRRMYVPFHDGVISQFEGYGDLAELDWDRLRRQYGNIQRLDRILEAEQDDVNRYKASKQADALMLLYLLSATSCVSYSIGSAIASPRSRFRRWSTTTWPARRTGRRSAVWCTPGCWPGPTASEPWNSFNRR